MLDYEAHEVRANDQLVQSSVAPSVDGFVSLRISGILVIGKRFSLFKLKYDMGNSS